MKRFLRRYDPSSNTPRSSLTSSSGLGGSYSKDLEQLTDIDFSAAPSYETLSPSSPNSDNYYATMGNTAVAISNPANQSVLYKSEKAQLAESLARRNVAQSSGTVGVASSGSLTNTGSQYSSSASSPTLKSQLPDSAAVYSSSSSPTAHSPSVACASGHTSPTAAARGEKSPLANDPSNTTPQMSASYSDEKRRLKEQLAEYGGSRSASATTAASSNDVSPIQQRTLQTNDVSPIYSRVTNITLYQAIYPYTASSDLELTLSEGQIVSVLSRHDLDGNSEWWLVSTREGKQGYVPANYLYQIQQP